MISKELLSEVLGKTVDIVYTKDHVGNDFKTFIRPRYGDFLDEINIYELAHKCKEWAKNKGYYLLSGIYTYNDKTDGTYDCLINQNFTYEDDGCHITRSESCLESFNGFGTEPEAIFRATQWILDNKDKQ